LSKRHDKLRRKTRRSFETAEVIELHGSKFQSERRTAPIVPINDKQSAYLDASKSSAQVAVFGPAGTGKTWIAATYAADLYRQRRIDKIILTRPNVPSGRSLGLFPGGLNEKFAPWVAPVVEAIVERIGPGRVRHRGEE
jgi:phosphate starvation-inducible protein PhoH and related proteins